jgi:hypothetical protein
MGQYTLTSWVRRETLFRVALDPLVELLVIIVNSIVIIFFIILGSFCNAL